MNNDPKVGDLFVVKDKQITIYAMNGTGPVAHLNVGDFVMFLDQTEYKFHSKFLCSVGVGLLPVSYPSFEKKLGCVRLTSLKSTEGIEDDHER